MACMHLCGMCVFFIHLYIGKIKVYLKNLYYLSWLCLAVLLFIGKGSLTAALGIGPYGPLLLLPLSGCLGFVTAKEAFCFRLFEGYLLAMIMPFYLLLVSGGILTGTGVSSGLVLIAAVLIIFTLRKAFMPLAYDIGRIIGLSVIELLLLAGQTQQMHPRSQSTFELSRSIPRSCLRPWRV